jgi:molecular chaperone DnaK
VGYRLGVDLGTTYTAAAVNVDGRVEMLGLGIRAMQVPSVVFVRRGGEIVVGEAAEQQGAAEPSRVVREFKRRIGDSVPLVVGGAPFSAQALTARLLAWVVGIATERQGGPPEHVCVTHPANWGPFKRDLLGQAVEMAGLRNVEMCTEPEAAAITYASRNRVAEGDRVAVYDLGGGTFDAAVLVPDGAGFRLAGPPEGVEQLGGIDFDEAVFRHVLTSLGPEVADLDDMDPATATALARLRRDCVEAKEVLSFSIDTVVPVALPGITKSVRLTRGDLDDMLRPAIAETVSATRRVLDSARVDPGDLAAIVLVGGSSRIPLVSEMLSAEFSRPLAIDNHPKHDVALGAAIRGTPAARPAAARPAPTPTAAQTAAAAAVGAGAATGPPTMPAAHAVSSTATDTPYGTPVTAAYTGADTGAAQAVPPGPPPGPAADWRPPPAVGPMTSPAGATGLTARLPAAVQGKRGRLLIGTGAVVVAIAVGAGILLGTRKAEPDPSLTGVQAPIPTFAPAPLPVPIPVVPEVIPSETLTPTVTPPPPAVKAPTKRTRAATTTRRTTKAVVPRPPPPQPKPPQPKPPESKQPESKPPESKPPESKPPESKPPESSTPA